MLQQSKKFVEANWIIKTIDNTNHTLCCWNGVAGWPKNENPKLGWDIEMVEVQNMGDEEYDDPNERFVLDVIML